VSIPLNSNTITSGYKANNPSADVSAFFSSDRKNYNVYLVNGEIRFSTIKENYETVTFYECSWDADKKVVIKKQRTADCIPLEGKNDEWQNLGQQGKTTWYYVGDDAKRKVIVIYGEVHLVLGAYSFFDLTHIKLEAKNGATLHIHSTRENNAGQNYRNSYRSEAWGKINVYNTAYKDAAVIGGGDGESMGTLVVHGGTIRADYPDNDFHISSAATIGGGYKGGGGTLIVYDGKIKADGNMKDAGTKTRMAVLQSAPAIKGRPAMYTSMAVRWRLLAMEDALPLAVPMTAIIVR